MSERVPTRDEIVEAIAQVAWRERVNRGDIAGPWELEGWETPQMVDAHHELQASLRRQAAPFADAVLALLTDATP